MSEAKFTKGEWEILPIEDDKEYIRIRGTLLGSKHKIANVVDLKAHYSNADWCKRDRAESMANAQLIVAAPKMYKFLDDLASGRGVDYPIEQLLKEVRGE